MVLWSVRWRKYHEWVTRGESAHSDLLYYFCLKCLFSPKWSLQSCFHDEEPAKQLSKVQTPDIPEGLGYVCSRNWWELGRWTHRCMCMPARRAAMSVCSQAAQIWCIMHSWVVLFLPRKCPRSVYPAFGPSLECVLKPINSVLYWALMPSTVWHS